MVPADGAALALVVKVAVSVAHAARAVGGAAVGVAVTN